MGLAFEGLSRVLEIPSKEKRWTPLRTVKGKPQTKWLRVYQLYGKRERWAIEYLAGYDYGCMQCHRIDRMVSQEHPGYCNSCRRDKSPTKRGKRLRKSKERYQRDVKKQRKKRREFTYQRLEEMKAERLREQRERRNARKSE